MVNASLSLGGLVGVLLSAGFVYWEVGRYAAPQVPRTLFDERKELFAYTAGLFVGVPLALPFLFFLTAMSNAALPGALLFLALLVAGTELAQRLLLRTIYFGSGKDGPFYALGFRAGVGGILVLAIVAQYFAGSAVNPQGLGLVLIQSLAIIALEVAGALLSLSAQPGSARVGGGPISGLLFGAVGFFLLGFGAMFDQLTGALGAGVALLGAILVYRRLRPVLRRIPPPATAGEVPETKPGSPFGRTDR